MRKAWTFLICGKLTQLRDCGRTLRGVTGSNRRATIIFSRGFLVRPISSGIFHFLGFCTSALDSTRPSFKSPSRWPRIRDRILHAVRIILQAVRCSRHSEQETGERIAAFHTDLEIWVNGATARNDPSNVIENQVYRDARSFFVSRTRKDRDSTDRDIHGRGYERNDGGRSINYHRNGIGTMLR